MATKDLGMTKHDLLKSAASCERKAWFWASQINNHPYLTRYNMTSADAEYQLTLAAGFAVEYYARAARLSY